MSLPGPLRRSRSLPRFLRLRNDSEGERDRSEPSLPLLLWRGLLLRSLRALWPLPLQLRLRGRMGDIDGRLPSIKIVWLLLTSCLAVAFGSAYRPRP